MSLTPFDDMLDEVIVYTGTTLVSLETLTEVQNFLSNQEDKIKALNKGLAQSLLGHYDKAKKDGKNEAVRVAIVDTLTSLALLSRGRTTLLKKPIGKERLLRILKDPSPLVRAAGCKLFSTFSLFPDISHVMQQGSVVFKALVRVLLEDDISVSKETIKGLTHYSLVKSSIDEATMRRLLELLTQQPTLSAGILQTLWNCCKEDKEKELAIDCNAVTELCSFLDNPDITIRRLTVGTLMAISGAEAGKVALIAQEDAVATLVQFNEDATEKDLQTNSRMTLRNIVEHPTGRTNVGAMLIATPETMLETLQFYQIAEVIDPLLDGGKGEPLANACKTLLQLCKTEKGRNAAWNILELIPRLHEISSQADTSQLRWLPRKIINAIISDNQDARAVWEKIPKQATEPMDMKVDSTLPPNDTAILLLQYQNDYIGKKGSLNADVQETLDHTQMLWHTVELVEKARKLGVTIIHLPMSFVDDGKNDEGPLKDMVDAKAFTKGTWGAAITDELSPEAEDEVIHISKLSAFEETNLESFLHGKGIHDLLVCGLLGEAAVEHTVRDAYDRQFRVFGVGNCIASSSVEIQKVLEEQTLPKVGVHLDHKKALAMLMSA